MASPKREGDDVGRKKLEGMLRDPVLEEAVARGPEIPVDGEEASAPRKPYFLNTDEYNLGRQIVRGERAALPAVAASPAVGNDNAPQRVTGRMDAGPPAEISPPAEPSPPAPRAADPVARAPRPESAPARPVPSPERRKRAIIGPLVLVLGVAVFAGVAVLIAKSGTTQATASQTAAPVGPPPTSSASSASAALAPTESASAPSIVEPSAIVSAPLQTSATPIAPAPSFVRKPPPSATGPTPKPSDDVDVPYKPPSKR